MLREALMKSIYKLSLVVLAVIGLSACNHRVPASASTSVELTTEAQKEAYSVGASIGRYTSGHIKEQEDWAYQLIAPDGSLFHQWSGMTN